MANIRSACYKIVNFFKLKEECLLFRFFFFSWLEAHATKKFGLKCSETTTAHFEMPFIFAAADL